GKLGFYYDFLPVCSRHGDIGLYDIIEPDTRYPIPDTRYPIPDTKGGICLFVADLSLIGSIL
ncbi:MAG: hypothetical protein FWD36_08720, partial [Treponema sp.]|nr:hypothetical protein [Treponema sp.]